MLIMQDALPLFKSFLKPVSLEQRARQLLLRCVIAFLMHLGKMSASRVAGAVPLDARHRGLSQSIPGTPPSGGDAISSANCVLNCLNWKRGKGMFVFDIDQTYCSQQAALSQKCQPHAARRIRRWMNQRIFGRKPAIDGRCEYSPCIASRRNS